MEVVDAAIALATDAETQMCNDSNEREWKMNLHCLSTLHTNQDLYSSVADLTAVNDMLSLSTDFLWNNSKKLRKYRDVVFP